MSKTLYSRVNIQDINLLRDLDETELLDYVKRQLAKEMVEHIVSNEEVRTLKREYPSSNFGEQFTMSLTVVNPDKYNQLSSIIKFLDLKYIDEDNTTIYLKDLL